jgi:hypothetical protein
MCYNLDWISLPSIIYDAAGEDDLDITKHSCYVPPYGVVPPKINCLNVYDALR